MLDASDLFISYARSDDEAFVQRLYHELVTAEYQVWWDRASMPSRSLTFLHEIREAVDNAARLIIVLGPSAVQSDYVRAEWQYALTTGKVVIPILRLGTYDLIPPELRNLHCPDFRADRSWDEALAELFRVLHDPLPLLGPVFYVPEPPPRFQPRPDDLTRLAKTILIDLRQPVVVTAEKRITILHGMGGVGKSVLAAAFAHTTEARRAFADGVAWVHLGQSPDLEQSMERVMQVFTGESRKFMSLEDSTIQLKRLLADKRCLIVLDDAWDIAHLTPFSNALDTLNRLLITTREAGLISSLGAQEQRVDVLNTEAALRQLADWSECSPSTLPPQARDVAAECGNLPFALALCGALIRDGLSWGELLDALRDADLAFIEKQFPNYPYRDILKSLKVSMDVLEQADPIGARHYRELAVFPQGDPVPEAVPVMLWLHTNGVSERQARKLLVTLANKSLLRLDGRQPHRTFTLHDLQYDYLRSINENSSSLHGELVEAYRLRSPNGWSSGPDDGYFLEHLAHHLLKAGQKETLYRLIDRPWMDIHFQSAYSYRSFAGDVAEVIEAASAGKRPDFAQLIRGCLIFVTLSSISSNVPPAVLGALARVGETAKALGYAGLTQNEGQQFLAYQLIGEELLNRGAKDEAIHAFQMSLTAARMIEQIDRRNSALARAAKALEIADSFSQDNIETERVDHATHEDLTEEQARAATVSPQSSDGQSWEQAVAEAELIENEATKAQMLIHLAKQAPLTESVERSKRMLILADTIGHIGDKAEVLGCVVRALTKLGEFERALAAAEAIADSEAAHEAAHEAVLKNFDPDTAGYYAMEIGFATLRLEQRLISEKMDAFHVIISALALIASPRQLDLAVSAASTINNNELVVLRRVCHALIGTTDYQELEQVSDVEMTEDGARKNWAFDRKEWALNSVALALAKVGQHARARQVAAGIEDLGIRAGALCGLAAILARAGEFALALEILETVEDTEAGMSWSKKAAIVILARLAGQDWAPRLLAVAESITNDDARAQALVAVALAFADSGDREGLRRVVNDVQVIEYEHLRAEALGAVAQALARAGDLEMLRHCLLAVRGIVEPWSRAVYLVGVCLGLGRMEDLDGLNRALTLAVEIDEQARSTALRGIARAMAQAGDKAGIKRVFAATQAIQDERERAIVLGGPRLVLTYQDTDLIHEMYVSDQARVGVASALAELGDFDCIQQAFDFVSSMEDTDSRTEGLTGVIIAMAKTGNSDLLSRALALIESEGLSEGFISSMTEAMASRRDANGLQRILTVAEETEDPYLRAQALTCLAKAYSALGDVQGLEKTLSLAEAYTYEAAKADAVAGVALALAQSKEKDVVRLRRVLAAAASVSYEPQISGSREATGL